MINFSPARTVDRRDDPRLRSLSKDGIDEAVLILLPVDVVEGVELLIADGVEGLQP